ncbi:hypothetical protein ACVWWG_001914 [Bradyrhizobium sp. LB7.2]
MGRSCCAGCWMPLHGDHRSLSARSPSAASFPGEDRPDLISPPFGRRSERPAVTSRLELTMWSPDMSGSSSRQHPDLKAARCKDAIDSHVDAGDVGCVAESEEAHAPRSSVAYRSVSRLSAPAGPFRGLARWPRKCRLPKRRAFGDARALGVYPSASADQLSAKGSRHVAQCGLGCRYNQCSRDYDLIGRRRREDDRVYVARERRRVLNIEIGSSSLLKNLEMENFHFSAGRFWSGAVELDVISSLLLSVPRRGVAMRRAVWEFGSGYRRSD